MGGMLTGRFEAALTYACRAHSDQLRKGTKTPYVAHLLAVASLALECGASENEAIAALLHDAVEDAGGKPRLEDIRREFGDEVATIVAGCTDADVIPKPPWQARKEAYIARLLGESGSVLLVSACDKLHNARSILTDLREDGSLTWSKFKGGKAGTLWYYQSLLEKYRARGDLPKRLVRELERTLDEIATLAAAE